MVPPEPIIGLTKYEIQRLKVFPDFEKKSTVKGDKDQFICK